MIFGVLHIFHRGNLAPFNSFHKRQKETNTPEYVSHRTGERREKE